ncbi:unnamed protein product [Soboliphyme baturini]|uniref:Autophagy protein 5 n=1 Tax=Soboliphyme baturini TaxID=241478 RepID=A0A3P8EJI2_9BILA|nr:unnamed protein product [Soboliphyme baturini]
MDSADDLWLECSGTPLKWHYPVGVLYDLRRPDETDDALPWHVTDFPENEILHFSTKEAIEAYFFQTVKEADQLKHRGEIISKMQKMEQKSMWNALLNDKFEQFWASNSRLMENSSINPIKYLPIRVYNKDQTFIQRLISTNNENGQMNTVLDMLRSFFPNRADASVDVLRVFCQSVHIPHCTPLLWLYVNMSYPDNFLHLCISEQ